ncbi:hypothetical protein [Massilia scottii]|uniref:hypothetical protein n=1 Tax=Massilia scottii TaxID=3057166 RepID=UPI002796B68D|nr:hypothetical protein [Massilia sp. CCM 9029]MDQ1829485.1 hypothetical protein [Massilia sp. CCM 9029]
MPLSHRGSDKGKPMEYIKSLFDGISYGLAVSAFLGFLPPFAALVSILWIGFQFYHSEPMRARRARRAHEKCE